MRLRYLYCLSGVLLSYIVLCFFRKPELSDALIIGMLSALSGYLHFLISREITPHPESKESRELALQIEQLKLQREVTNLNYDISRIMEQKKVVETNKKSFSF